MADKPNKQEAYKEMEQINDNYKKAKAAVENFKKEIEVLIIELETATANHNMIKTERANARKLGRPSKYTENDEKVALDEKNDKAKALKDKQTQLKDKQVEVANSMMQLIKKYPEIKKDIEILTTKRLKKSLNKEIAEIETYKKLQEIIQKHPDIEKTMKGIATRNRDILRLENRIKKIKEISAKPEEDRTEEEKSYMSKHEKRLTEYESTLIEKQTQKAQLTSQVDNFLKKNYPEVTDEQKLTMYGIHTIDIDKTIACKSNHVRNRQQDYMEEYQIVTGKEIKTDNSKGEKEKKPKQSIFRRLANWVKRALRGEKKPELPPAEAKPSAEELYRQSQKIPTLTYKKAASYDIVKDIMEKYETNRENIGKEAARKRREEAKGEMDKASEAPEVSEVSDEKER